MEAQGLDVPGGDDVDILTFSDPIRLSLQAEASGASEIRYTLDGEAPQSSRAGSSGTGDSAAAPVGSRTYGGPILIQVTTTVRAAAFDASGRRIGHEAGEIFHLVELMVHEAKKE